MSMNMTDDKCLFYMNFAGASTAAMEALISAYGSPTEVFAAANKGDIPDMPHVSAKLASKLCVCASHEYVERCMKWCERRGMGLVTINDGRYPALLRETQRPPYVLYVIGSLPDEIRMPIAVIGSRACSQYGSDMAFKLSKELAEGGACVVSGMAFGIDGMAARGALAASDARFPTVAVLGSGLLNIYPSSNMELSRKIAARGAVISEYRPDMRPLGHNFPARNRIIAGMSMGVVVVEAAMKSGTNYTVNFALDYGRDVFAVPGRATDPLSAGTNSLIREGAAKPCLCAGDILSEYGMTAKRAAAENKTDIGSLPVEQLLIYKLLCVSERSYDELLSLTGAEASRLNSDLTDMEFSEIISQSPGRVYGLTNT